ncbi:hypothetical protein BJX96DRAFT_177019 [Aspergillus floccosus]
MNYSYYPSDPTFNNDPIPFPTLDTQNGLGFHESSTSQPRIAVTGSASNRFSGRQETSPVPGQSLWENEEDGLAYGVNGRRWPKDPLNGSELFDDLTLGQLRDMKNMSDRFGKQMKAMSTRVHVQLKAMSDKVDILSFESAQVQKHADEMDRLSNQVKELSASMERLRAQLQDKCRAIDQETQRIKEQLSTDEMLTAKYRNLVRGLSGLRSGGTDEVTERETSGSPDSTD